MIISTRGRYALRILQDIAQQGEGGYIPLKTVAERQQISKKYADQIANQLSQAGILQGIRGPQGGYRLAVEPEKLTLLTILETTEGPLQAVSCLEDQAACARAGVCLAQPVWARLTKTIRDYLSGVTLADTLNQSSQP